MVISIGPIECLFYFKSSIGKSVIFLDWVNSGAPWRSRLWIGVDPVNLIGWIE